jgi:hypothetical protein
MPRIKIISKGLPKALAGLTIPMLTTTTTKDPLSGMSLSITDNANNKQAVNSSTLAQSSVAPLWHGELDEDGNNIFDAATEYSVSKSKNPITTNKSTITNPSALGKLNKGIDQAFTMANMVLSYFDKQKKQKEYNKWMGESMQPHNSYSVDTFTNRGDYDINDGMFKPDDMGYKSKGTQANPFGASSTFQKYGGMFKAADGITVPGDQIVQRVFLPDVSTDVVGPIRIDAPVNAPASENVSTKSYKSSGANPMASQTWNDYSKEFKGVTNLGIWGDKSHKARKSDHNTGDALDLGITDLNQGSAVAQQILADAKNRNVKYVIFNKQIWNPSISNEWRPYKGEDPHTGHVHISFNRSAKSSNDGQQISLSHNNPMNVHYGDFAAKYGAKPGADDNGGKVAIFPDLETGIQANKDLMFGSGYNNLTIAEARNKWVSGNSGKHNNSTDEIVKAMGGNKRLSALSPEEKDKLFKQFTKWEGKESYNIIKDRKIFNEGGQSTDNTTNMKIRIVGGPNNMAQGGESQYSGQSDYGLYIGQRNLYNTMAKNPYTEAEDKVKEQDETENNPYVLEAEGGETILRPDGTHMKISGSSHANGGVKLTKQQAPQGSFIYSDTQKMKIKNPQVLNYFGKSPKKSGITPADVAKQYDVNKYMGIIQNPYADPIAKKTAIKMIENYQRKLAELALVQESIKGFPQGIPEVAKGLVSKEQGQQQGEEQSQAAYGGYFANGGMPDYAMGGGCPPGELFDEELQMCVKFPRSSENNFQNNNNRYYQQYGNRKPVGLGFNFNNDKKTYNIGVGANSVINNGKVGNIDYNASAEFPRLFGNNKGLSVTGNYAGGNLRIGANTKFPLLGGTLGINGRYIQNFNDQNSNSKSMMMSRPNTSQPDLNVGAEWNGKIGKTNVKISGNYGTPAGRFAQGGVPQYQIAGETPADEGKFDPNDIFGIKRMLFNAGSANNVNGVAKQAGPYPNALNTYVPAWFKPWLKSNTKAGGIGPEGKSTTFDPQDPNKFYVDYNYWKGLNNGKHFNGPKEYQNFVYNYVKDKDPKAIDAMWQKWGTTAKGKGLAKDQQFSIDAFSDSDAAPADKPYFGARTAEVTGWRDKTPTPTITPTPTKTPTTTITNTKPVLTDIVVPEKTPNTTVSPYKWTNQDVRNLGNAGLDYASLKKYHPYRASVQPVLPEFIPTDWRGYAASLQSQQNKAAEQMATYQPGQALGANLSFLQGQTGNALSDYISKVDQYNASGATSMDTQRAGMQNQFNMYNAENRNKNYEDENVYDDRYRTAERLGRKGIVKAWNQGEDTASKIYNLNQTESPYYKINPYTQQIVFNYPGAKEAWEASIRGGAPVDDVEAISQKIVKARSLPGFAGYKTQAEQDEAIKDYLGYGSSRSQKNKEVTTTPGYNGVKTVNTTYDDDQTTKQVGQNKFGGGVGASYVKSISEWYNKLNYIADPNERQRLAEAYASKMHFGR